MNTSCYEYLKRFTRAPVYLVVLFLLMSFVNVSGQSKKKDFRMLTYVHTGLGYPCFGNPDTLSEYGFRVVDGGCIRTKAIVRNNRRVVKKMDKRFGNGWFDSMRGKFCGWEYLD